MNISLHEYKLYIWIDWHSLCRDYFANKSTIEIQETNYASIWRDDNPIKLNTSPQKFEAEMSFCCDIEKFLDAIKEKETITIKRTRESLKKEEVGVFHTEPIWQSVAEYKLKQIGISIEKEGWFEPMIEAVEKFNLDIVIDENLLKDIQEFHCLSVKVIKGEVKYYIDFIELYISLRKRYFKKGHNPNISTTIQRIDPLFVIPVLIVIITFAFAFSMNNQNQKDQPSTASILNIERFFRNT